MGDRDLLRKVAAAVVAYSVSFLDLASHSRAKRVSRRLRCVCQMRAASPAIVCCRNIPMCARLPAPRERERQQLDRVYKKVYDVHAKTYADGPSRMWISETGCRFGAVLPVDIPDSHSLWNLAPRVLDLHHVRLQPQVLAKIIRVMPFLRTLCMDARDTPGLRALGQLGALRYLCLYGVCAEQDYEDLRRLRS